MTDISSGRRRVCALPEASRRLREDPVSGPSKPCTETRRQVDFFLVRAAKSPQCRPTVPLMPRPRSIVSVTRWQEVLRAPACTWSKDRVRLLLRRSLFLSQSLVLKSFWNRSRTQDSPQLVRSPGKGVSHIQTSGGTKVLQPTSRLSSMTSPPWLLRSLVFLPTWSLYSCTHGAVWGGLGEPRACLAVPRTNWE